MENIKVIFIDIDNTLLDFDKCIKTAFIQGFERYGLGVFTEDMYRTFQKVNTEMWQRLERGEIDLAELKRVRFCRVFDEIGIDFDGVEFERYFRSYVHECVIPVDGAYELLEALEGKYTLCTASNGPEEQQRHRMDLSGMGKYFEHIFVSEGLGIQKPHKEFFTRALSQMNGVKPSDCLIIGDSLTSDIQGGINAGMKTIYFNKHKEANTKGIKPDYEFDTLEEIAEFLK